MQKSLVDEGLGENLLGEMSDSGSEIDWEAEERMADLEEQGSREAIAHRVISAIHFELQFCRFLIAKGWPAKIKKVVAQPEAKALGKLRLNQGSRRRRVVILKTKPKRKS